MDTSGGPSQFSSMPCSTQDRIIIGVDYGTTGTGISVILVEGQTGATRCGFITQWLSGANQAKVPSRIAYACNNPSFSMPSSCWGFEIHPDMNACSWTKLLLDHNTELAEFDDEVLRAAVSSGIFDLARGKAPVDAITDYLKHVLSFAWGIIRQDFDVSLDHIPINLQFTVPATWSQESRVLSKQAVTRAWRDKRPQDTITFMSEPEAAAEAVYKLHRSEFKVGDGILICDCGGGTVDIATYLVTDCDQFSLSRITSVQGILLTERRRGGKCGGTAIDSRLYGLINKRFPGAFKSLNYLIAPGSKFMRAFEDVKTVFGEDERRKTFRLPLNLRRGQRGCTLPYFDPKTKGMILSEEDTRNLYNPVISKIISLINSQIMAADENHGSPVINVASKYNGRRRWLGTTRSTGRLPSSAKKSSALWIRISPATAP
ncbi:hypothetical protein P168DRAFT_282023 [Aspergillus campestris IBT 28561]|uniref:Actin-like ATPase domain-containing protein n=1 Tax=Aspergillus campestris (strain IBT 28561) TaxID=1392248 RepID=A0A2I1D3E8_ASPC2|nr:uncharacterized protein P168DRAFT_282023 [Aspergillus campestris IBT 28561]PKY04394.1 hypothetical protein P168DRAFT_282023 [Aspergillus campestris IBT 28561]